MKLTKRTVDAIRPDPLRDVFVWDAGLKGFGLRMKPSGIASYIVQYRTPEGRTRRLALGKVGVLTPDKARDLAQDKLSAVKHGADPSAERHAARTALTISELCDEYMQAARAGLVTTRFRRPKRASTVAIDAGRIERHIKPQLGTVRADKLARRDVQRMADAIAEGKTAATIKTKARGKAVVTGGAGTAARVVELLGGIWTWAEKRGLVSGPNPAHGVETTRGEAKDRVLSPAELKILGKVLKAKEETSPAAVAAVRLIALTGLRREEACSLKWEEVDEGSSCLRLATTKTGRSTRPIGQKAFDLLKDLRTKALDLPADLPRDDPRRNPRWVFPNRDGSGSTDLKKQIAGLFDAAGLADARSHDLRRTFASFAADEGYSDATIGELLGHARRGVTARHYIRRPDAALVAAADAVSTRIATLLDAGQAAAEVILLPSRQA